MRDEATGASMNSCCAGSRRHLRQQQERIAACHPQAAAEPFFFKMALHLSHIRKAFSPSTCSIWPFGSRKYRLPDCALTE